MVFFFHINVTDFGAEECPWKLYLSFIARNKGKIFEWGRLQQMGSVLFYCLTEAKESLFETPLSSFYIWFGEGGENDFIQLGSQS